MYMLRMVFNKEYIVYLVPANLQREQMNSQFHLEATLPLVI